LIAKLMLLQLLAKPFLQGSWKRAHKQRQKRIVIYQIATLD